MGDIYKLTSPSGKIYVGKAVQFLPSGKKWGYMSRWKSHVHEATKTTYNYSRLLNNAIRKYGADQFTVELIEQCTEEELDGREQYYIAEYNCMTPNGYNLTTGGTQGSRQSQETCIKKGLSMIGKNVGRSMEKRPRKKPEDNVLPKYIVSHINGYKVDRHPSKITKCFGCKEQSMEEKLQLALNFLDELNKSYELTKLNTVNIVNENK